MKLLLAEDEKDMSRVLKAIFEHEGYPTDVANDGQEAVDLASQNVYDCMIMDIMMPRKDGITALKEIRASGDTTPVIMLTAKAEVDDRIRGLDTGADDYLTKPFSVKELLARIRSQVRRGKVSAPLVLSMGNTRLNTGEQELSAGNSIRLSSRETRLLQYFLQQEGTPIPSDKILKHVWNDEPDASVDELWIYINYLRQKLESVNSDLILEGEKDGPFSLHIK